ncbi:hypothetical protein GLAREA_01288 [Glarea lozoyensis ATCC 20868]|uniref:Heterokaryon incompatibility domain-containing protein n=1 Tax=Glarea lozoyensis (strain ATCC 20868 / MF5171) TaxID=1116229 RepID=S3CZY7_GLAL2|nr:uncharacterized protein GLAREA_01288 [Glarea lozoyensis ATCC 20868]EPE25376.1 hypothetical protein GLAREA_01288 [Glarea lozoyensis ATCC 20868]
MKEWLQKCDHEHPGCKPQANKLPKRLVSIGSSMMPRLNLVSTQGLDPETIQYATLSYCWGSAGIPVKTTRSNKATYFEAIPTKDFPKTFEDALLISRSLNISYLWMDALCIVQDDEDDWRAEITKMSDIYFGSTLTIAASEAKDCTGGFFAHPLADNSNEERTKNRYFFTVERRPSTDILVQVEPREGGTNGRISNLHTRGWTLQEVALSHRTVQFTQSELHWRCRNAYWTESGMTYDPLTTVYGNVPLSGNEHVVEPVITWWKWIESYSTRKFSVPSDRIPAIYGLIKYHQSLTGDTSAFGLWRRSLHQDMLWIRIERLTDISLTSPYTGSIPSWSWLSCPVGVAFDFFGKSSRQTETSDHITIQDYELLWVGEPLISAVKSCNLTISGPAQEVYLEIAPEGRHCNPPYYLVEGEAPDFSKSALPWGCSAQFDREQERSPDTFFCVLVRRRLEVSTGYRTETFLILEPADTLFPHEKFRRIGLGVFRGSHDRFSSNTMKTINLV